MIDTTMKGIIEGSITLRVYHRSHPDSQNIKLYIVYLNGKSKWIKMEEPVFNMVFYMMNMYKKEFGKKYVDELLPLIHSAGLNVMRRVDISSRRRIVDKVEFAMKKHNNDGSKLDYEWLLGYIG